MIIQCGNCGQFGHNKAACKGGATKNEQKVQQATKGKTYNATRSKAKGKKGAATTSNSKE